jgi:hypothetical protein
MAFTVRHSALDVAKGSFSGLSLIFLAPPIVLVLELELVLDFSEVCRIRRIISPLAVDRSPPTERSEHSSHQPPFLVQLALTLTLTTVCPTDRLVNS